MYNIIKVDSYDSSGKKSNFAFYGLMSDESLKVRRESMTVEVIESNVSAAVLAEILVRMSERAANKGSIEIDINLVDIDLHPLVRERMRD